MQVPKSINLLLLRQPAIFLLQLTTFTRRNEARSWRLIAQKGYQNAVSQHFSELSIKSGFDGFLVRFAVPEDLVAVLGEEECYLRLAVGYLNPLPLNSGLVALLQNTLNIVHSLHLNFEKLIKSFRVICKPTGDIFHQ